MNKLYAIFFLFFIFVHLFPAFANAFISFLDCFQRTMTLRLFSHACLLLRRRSRLLLGFSAARRRGGVLVLRLALRATLRVTLLFVLQAFFAAIVLFVVLGSAANQVFAQPPGRAGANGSLDAFRATSLFFEHISYEQGLSESNITALLQDKQGFLWIGTANGLNRYDGYSIIVYRNDPNDSTSLANNAITALYETADGLIWIGAQNGLHSFDKRTGRFTHHHLADADDFSSNALHVRSLLESPRGVLWVGTKRGLYRFDRERNEWKRFKADKKGRGKGPTDNDVHLLLRDPANRAHIWIGMREGGVNKFHIPDERFFIVAPPRGEDDDNQRFGAAAMAFDNAGSLWVADLNGSLWTCNPETETFRRIVQLESSERQLVARNGRARAIQTLAIDKRGVIWIGARTGLLSAPADKASNIAAWRRCSANPNNIHSLSDDNVTVITEDRSGVLWFGTQGGGLNKHAPRTSVFRNVQYNQYAPTATAQTTGAQAANGFPSPVVNAIARKSNGETWFATAKGVIAYAGDAPTRATLLDDAALSLLHDSQGSTWVGTEAGLVRIDRAGTQQRFEYNPGKPQSLRDNLVTALAEDTRGNIWIGTQGGGVSRFSLRSQTFAHYQADDEQEGALSDNFVFSLIVAKNGAVWIGTNNGLNRYNPEKDVFTAFARAPSTQSAPPSSGFAAQRISPMRVISPLFPDAPIVALYEAADGALWLGTLGGGLYRFDEATGEILRFSKKDRLPSETIYSIAGDARGNIWCGTSRGLLAVGAEVKRKTSDGGSAALSRLRVYGVAEGLHSATFRKGAVAAMPDGSLFFGMGTGFVSFYPDSLRDNVAPPPVALTRFHVFGDSVGGAATSPLQTEFYLDYNDNFEIEFAALDFTNPERHQYAYRIEGVHKEWVYAGQNRRITGANFDPGEYVWRIAAANSDGVWNKEALKILIVIHPPWWETWWFRATVFLACCGIIIGAYRWRVRQMAASNERLQELVETRTREISEQKRLLELQAAEIQLANGALQEKNVELDKTLAVSEKARQDLERAYKLLDAENARKTQELEEARAFQLSMLPKRPPEIEGLDIACAIRTASEVGGDYYDFLHGSGASSLIFAIGDATGHGVRAGMLVSLVKSSFHALAPDYALGETAAMISQNIKQMKLQRMFMCLLLLRLEPVPQMEGERALWKLTIAGAGMPPMLIYRAQEGKVEQARASGIVLGAMESAQYPESTYWLYEGDTLALMSDGIIELFDASGEELGSHRVRERFLQTCNAAKGAISASAVVNDFHYLCDDWLGGDNPQDDIALIAVRVGARQTDRQNSVEVLPPSTATLVPVI
jgi:ligand-binding sensor domain-containing protein/serine phosphatase RsbU (regulator of sigma subunit)